MTRSELLYCAQCFVALVVILGGCTGLLLVFP